MLDQRQIRENPTLIEEGLRRRGLNIDLTTLKLKSQEHKEIEKERKEGYEHRQPKKRSRKPPIESPLSEPQNETKQVC